MGYLLGLGDRHPSNLMLDRYSGKLLHIDFGDCFEASMHREKFPEKVLLPFIVAAFTSDEPMSWRSVIEPQQEHTLSAVGAQSGSSLI